MHTFSEKSTAPNLTARSSLTEPATDTIQGFEPQTVSPLMNPLQAKLNQTSSSEIQLKLQQNFSQTPRLVAQAKLGEKLAQRKSPIQPKCDMCEVSDSEEKLKKLKKESDPTEDEEDTVIQSKSVSDTSASGTPPSVNQTGLPDELKTGIESLSGMSLDDVNVHYNSSQPAQLQALAYTQGTDIHVAPGQEQHLAHEAWHVVQQKQGRVQPTMQLQGKAVNDEVELEHEADLMGGKALQAKVMEPHPASNQETVRSPSTIQLLEMETEDGTWDFSEYAIQNSGGWRGLAEHTLAYRPRGGIGEDQIVLIQAIQSTIDDEIIHSDAIHENRTNQETGFRIDNFTDSNNPIFGAASAGSLAGTASLGDTYQIGGRVNKGSLGRPKIVEQTPSRLDNPGFGIKNLREQKADKLPMGQTIITAAYNVRTGQYLGSIAYGWIQEQDGEPQLLEMTYTTGGVSDVFVSAAAQWNQGKTKGRANIQLPAPQGVEVRSFQEEEEQVVDDLDQVEGNQMEDDVDMDDVDMDELGLTFEEWLQQLKQMFFLEYRAKLTDYPDQPYRLGFEEGMSPQEFYAQFLANGRAF